MAGVGEVERVGLGQALAPLGVERVVEAEIASAPDDENRVVAKPRDAGGDRPERRPGGMRLVHRDVLHEGVHRHAIGPRVVGKQEAAPLVGR